MSPQVGAEDFQHIAQRFEVRPRLLDRADVETRDDLGDGVHIGKIALRCVAALGVPLLGQLGKGPYVPRPDDQVGGCPVARRT